MGNFIAQDVLALVATLIASIIAAYKIPGFPDNNSLAKFIYGYHITVIVAIFTLLTNPNVPLLGNVEWLYNWIQFPFPHLIYVIVIGLGMTLLLFVIVQSVFIKVNGNNLILVPVSSVMFLADIFVLIHIMWIL